MYQTLILNHNFISSLVLFKMDSEDDVESERSYDGSDRIFDEEVDAQPNKHLPSDESMYKVKSINLNHFNQLFRITSQF